MVYPGHASRGCETCRARKVKCDEAKPTCLRCVKAKRSCLGYRMLDDSPTQKNLMNQTTSKKSKPSIPSLDFAVIKSRNQSSIVSDHVSGVYVSPLLDSLSSFPRLSLNQVNLHRLSSHIARLPQITGVYDGCLTCLPSVSESLSPSSPLYPALSALLLAFVSRGHDGTRTMEDAGENYGQALRLIRRAINQKDATRKKEILLTTLILSMYEDLVNPQQQLTSLNPHFRGAISLMKAQSGKEIKDVTMKRLYGAFITRVMYSSYQNIARLSNEEFPLAISELRELYDTAPISGGLTAPRQLLQPAMCKLLEAHLRLRKVKSRISPGNLISTIESAIENIAEVEREMTHWPQIIPVDYTPEMVLLPPDTVDPWSTTAIVYTAFWVANAWAHYRAVRIFANDLLLWAYNLITPAVVSESTSLSLAELAIGMEIAQKQICTYSSEICASMPYHLGYIVQGSGKLRYPKEGFPTGLYARKMSACNIVWPLYTAGIVDGLIPSQKLWIARQLDFLSTHVGVKQASSLAMLVRNCAYKSNGMECLLVDDDQVQDMAII